MYRVKQFEHIITWLHVSKVVFVDCLSEKIEL